MTDNLKFTVNGNHFVHAGGLASMVPFAKEADRLGYDYLRLLDHVVGVDAEKHGGIDKTPYTAQSQLLEVFTLIAYLSAMTERLGYMTGVLGLPARQTALVAKQAAQVDILCGGRFVMGVGIGYNPVEFEAMEFNFKERAPRIEEQIHVLRLLWSGESISFDGRWHHFQDVNINPAPPERRIPIWMGGGRTDAPVPPPPVLNRVGRLADGFMPLFRIDEATGRLPDDQLAALEVVRAAMVEAGRDPATLGLEISLHPHGKERGRVMEEIDYLASIGVTNVHLRFPHDPVERQLEYIQAFAELRDAYRAAA